MDSFIKFWGSFNHVLLCKHIWLLAPPISFSNVTCYPAVISWKQHILRPPISPMNRRGLSLFSGTRLILKVLFLHELMPKPFSMIYGDSELLFIFFCKIPTTHSPKFLVPYEKDTTIKSDSKQKMISWWNRTESGRQVQI